MLRWFAVFFGIVVSVLFAVVLYLFQADLGHLRDRLSVLISESLGREVRIDGPLSLRLGKLANIHAEDVSVANPVWIDEPFLFKADSLTARVALWSVVRGPLRIERLELSGAELRLQEDRDGRRNWVFREQDAQIEASATPETASPPRIEAFTARELLVLVSRPAFTRQTEIAIDTAEFGSREGLFTAHMSAQVNGVPLQLQSDAGPADGAADARTLDLRVNASLGEVTLQGEAEGIDLRTLALSSAQIEMEGPDAGYLLDILNLPPITSGPLDLEATLAPDPVRSAFNASAHLGEYRLAAEGWFADVRGPGGLDVRWRFAGSDLALIGQRLATVKLPDAPFEAEGTLRSQGGRIDIDDASITVGEMIFRAQASVVERDDGGKETLLNVDYGGVSGRVAISTVAGLSLDGADFDFTLQGRDAGAAAEAVGLDGVGAMPFVATGHGTYETGGVVLDAASLELGAQRLRLIGRVDTRPRAAGADLRFTAEKIDMTPWLAADDYLAPTVQTVSATGRVRQSGEWLNIDELSVKAGPALLEGELAFHAAASGDSGRFDLRLTAPSVAGLSPALDRIRRVDERFTMRGTGVWRPQGVEIRDAALQLSDRGELRGSLDYIRGERPFVSVALTADYLDLQAEEKPRARAAAGRSHGRIIPNRAIPTGWMAGFDADLSVDVASVRSRAIAGALLRMSGTLRDGRLEITNLETDGRRGRLTWRVTAEPTESAYAVHLDLEGRDLYIARPDESDAVLVSRPAYDMTAKLGAQGADMRALADTLTGYIRVDARAGTITRRENLLSTLIFEDTLTRVFETINPRVGKRDALQLNCLVLRLDFEEGVARGDPLFAVKTEDANVLARGNIDLSTESLDVDILARPRRGLGISLGDLINPFTRIGGTLASPRIVADPKSAVLETSTGIATGGLWPLGKKLLQRLFDSDACTKAMETKSES